MKIKLSPPNIISRNTVFKSKFFKIDNVVFEKKGLRIVKDIIRRNPAVFILPLTENNKIYLVSQYRDALEKVSLEVIAGVANESEDILHAAKRELREETGLTAKKWQKLATFNIAANMTSYAHIFLARDLSIGNSSPDEDEEINITLLPLMTAVEKVISGKINNSPSVASILLLMNLLKEKKD